MWWVALASAAVARTVRSIPERSTAMLILPIAGRARAIVASPAAASGDHSRRQRSPWTAAPPRVRNVSRAASIGATTPAPAAGWPASGRVDVYI